MLSFLSPANPNLKPMYLYSINTASATLKNNHNCSSHGALEAASQKGTLSTQPGEASQWTLEGALFLLADLIFCLWSQQTSI